MGHTNTNNMNQQAMGQKRASPQGNKQETNQATTSAPNTQEQDDATSEDQYFSFQDHNQNNWRE